MYQYNRHTWGMYLTVTVYIIMYLYTYVPVYIMYTYVPVHICTCIHNAHVLICTCTHIIYTYNKYIMYLALYTYHMYLYASWTPGYKLC